MEILFDIEAFWAQGVEFDCVYLLLVFDGVLVFVAHIKAAPFFDKSAQIGLESNPFLLMLG